VVDPNGIAGETPGFWWNPLSYVTGVTRARQLARIFVSAQRQPGESTDSYFDKAGPALIANLLLAAAVDGRPVTDLGDWLTRQTDRTPVQILRGKGFPSQGAEVEAVIDLHPKQRGGVFGTAQETMSFLTDPALAAWITPRAGAFDVQFDPDAFVRSTDTLYLLSKEGEGSAGPIITALTAAVCEAAVSYARTCPGGRLPVPLRVELDEAANICRWGDLPDLYSHFGSQLIEVTTYLQSYAQGEGVWGREGMRKLWSASNLRVIGPGVGEVGFLSDVSRLVGDVEQNRMSTGYGHAGRNVSYSTEWRPILPVNDLGALPGPTEEGDFGRARMLVLAAGLLPALVRPVPWWETEHADAVRASIALHEPGPVPVRMPAPPLPVEVRDVPRAGESGPWRKTADTGRNPYA
jgi:type IV secretory pathway TraG/TraD family ATPase VirD4